MSSQTIIYVNQILSNTTVINIMYKPIIFLHDSIINYIKYKT